MNDIRDWYEESCTNKGIKAQRRYPNDGALTGWGNSTIYFSFVMRIDNSRLSD